MDGNSSHIVDMNGSVIHIDEASHHNIINIGSDHEITYDTKEMSLGNDIASDRKDISPATAASASDANQNVATDTVNSISLIPFRLVLWMFLTIGVYFAKSAVNPTMDFQCMHDFVHEKLDSLNQLVREEPSFRMLLQVTSSALMDFTYLTITIHWVIYAKSSRFLVAMLLFYSVRALTQQYFVMGYPAGFTWDNPGIPSIVVPYGRSSDFFYSGHCGFLMICALEWESRGLKRMTILTHFINAYLAFVMLICQIHYSIDIFTGIIMGHYTFLMVTSRIGKFDCLLSENGHKSPSTWKPKRVAEANVVQNDRLIYAPPKKTEHKSYELDF